jgi:hypothetical protein
MVCSMEEVSTPHWSIYGAAPNTRDRKRDREAKYGVEPRKLFQEWSAWKIAQQWPGELGFGPLNRWSRTGVCRRFSNARGSFDKLWVKDRQWQCQKKKKKRAGRKRIEAD